MEFVQVKPFTCDQEFTNDILELSYELLQNSGVKQETLSFEGDNRLARLYKLIFFLDWVSYYVALLNHSDPSTIKNIEYIKEKNF